MLDIRDFRKLHFSLRQAIFSRLLFVFVFFLIIFIRGGWLVAIYRRKIYKYEEGA